MRSILIFNIRRFSSNEMNLTNLTKSSIHELGSIYSPKLDIDLPVKGSFPQCPSCNLTHQIAKYDLGGGKSSLQIWGKSSLPILGGVNRTDDLV